MKKQIIYIILNIVTTLVVAMFFSCNDSYKEVQKIGISENEPIGVNYNINLKYTDSGRVSANLISAKSLDYSNRDFPYQKFVEGVTLHIYDKDNKKSTVIAKEAYIYADTDLVDLQDSVVITTHDNRVLKTDQLFYDQKREWLYTNKAVSFITDGDIINGNGFDSNSKFTNAEVLEVTGIIALEE
ncbi:LPS export ABC transporter periplasmic protein LptC [uncultured Algibacter sp.]|uniref:LPS export ABC transporter periplasmic protein LptC n=1 Tax=uncultured Algibacter sp. TaxID=298659 RepID=UPI003216F526